MDTRVWVVNRCRNRTEAPFPTAEKVKLVVPWSLEQIGERRAIPSLIEAENDSSLGMRAVLAVEKLEGK